MASRILVIEDSRVIGEVIVFNLRQHGFHSHLAVNDHQAMEMIHKQTYQVVVMNYQTANINGEKICKAMREIPGYSNTPVIVCSSKCYELDAARLRQEFGVANVLPKPFSPAELVALVDEMAGTENNSFANTFDQHTTKTKHFEVTL